MQSARAWSPEKAPALPGIVTNGETRRNEGTLTNMIDQVLLAHGSGGRLTRELIQDVFLPAFQNPLLASLSDAACLPDLPRGRPAMTTDAFVVDPAVFPGGDLGYLSICGTVNDLSVAGAIPLYLTFAVIAEEGCPGNLIDTCVKGASRALAEAHVMVVAGDTKVVPKGKGDQLYICTSGLGVVPEGRVVSDDLVQVHDVIVVTGPIGDHGATIMGCRHGLQGNGLVSDCAPLSSLVEWLFAAGVEVHSMHDPTRGGVATTCHEVAARTKCKMVLEESCLPVRPEVRVVCEMLGLDVLSLPCEGRALAWIAAKDADRAIDVLAQHPQGKEARRIGRVEAAPTRGSMVGLKLGDGRERPVDLLSGLGLPRIC